MQVEKWNGYDIHFEERDGECVFNLNDICLASDMDIDTALNILNKGTIVENGMINEEAVYQIMLSSKTDIMLKFRSWSTKVLRKLREAAGLKSWEALKLSDPEVQETIDDILDTLFYDDRTGKIMQSVTIQGGDVEQVEFASI